MNTIISKRPSPFIYTKWSEHSVNGAFVEEYSILVNGGAGVMGGADFLLNGLLCDDRKEHLQYHLQGRPYLLIRQGHQTQDLLFHNVFLLSVDLFLFHPTKVAH